MFKRLVTLCAALPALAIAAVPSDTAQQTAQYALTRYRTDVVDALARMVHFNTVADPAVPFEKNPQQLGFKQLLKQEAERLGFDYADEGYVVRIGYGSGSERVGVITHGDVQPVDPSKWAKSPFELDRSSEQGKLLARGSEDDKGPIATALYAMKAIKDRGLPLRKRIELYVYMAEESDWAPLIAYLKTHTPPQMNITLDAEYPAVTAEKGYGSVHLSVPAGLAAPADKPAVTELHGGFFGSQIPEDAGASVTHVTAAMEAAIRARAAAQRGMRYTFTREGDTLKLQGHGLAAHSSKPEAGVNAIAMVADALAVARWPDSTAGAMVNFLNDLVGTGIYGERFGRAAYRDDFMGPLTLAPTVLKTDAQGLTLNINLRAPRGKTPAQLEADLRAAIDAWQAQHVKLAQVAFDLSEPWVQDSAPQLDTLLGVFSHYTGVKDARPVAIGGGTNSRLFPHAVSFGPAMPHTVYTGHSEHEFISEQQLLLNLQMYTAVLVELTR